MTAVFTNEQARQINDYSPAFGNRPPGIDLTAILEAAFTADRARLDALEAEAGVGGTLTTDTIAEETPGHGVIVDGCLIQDGRAAALAVAGMFKSAEITGNGGAQNTAHGLAGTPTLVFAIPSNLTGGPFVVVAGTHTSTNAVFTVTSGEKYKVIAFL